MKIAITLLLLVLSVVIAVSCSRRNRQQAGVSSSKSAELDGIPVRLKVEHAPNPVPAVRGGRSGCEYTWLHTTTVTALDDDITITEFGAFVWHNSQWVFSTIYDRPFTSQEFAEWYSCPDSRIPKGKSFTDPNNYTGADTLSSSKTKCYFVGTNSKGEQVKGEAVVEHTASVKD